jgi:hypothetical protein
MFNTDITSYPTHADLVTPLSTTPSFLGGGVPGTGGTPCLLGPWFSMLGGWNNESLFRFAACGNTYANGAGSSHTGGGHILMADGTVRFLSGNISANVWSALNTRAGGEYGYEF